MRFGTSRCESPGNSKDGHLVVLGNQFAKINSNGLGVIGLALLEDDGWEDITLLDDIDRRVS